MCDADEGGMPFARAVVAAAAPAAALSVGQRAVGAVAA